MNETLIRFAEPELEFRYGQRVMDPRDGLAFFGPYSAEQPSHPRSINYIVIGTDLGVTEFTRFVSVMSGAATHAPNENYRLWPPFPGFEAATASVLPAKPVRSYVLDAAELELASNHADKYRRTASVVEPYLNAIRTASTLDEPVGVAICVVPDKVWRDCRPESRPIAPLGQRTSTRDVRRLRAGQMDLFGELKNEHYEFSPDFRRQLKARSMEYNIPLQILLESTLRPNDEAVRGERALTPLSDRLWNISSTMLYKCGGKPWRLVSAREGVCYIGIAFRLTDDQRSACCAAQMFLDTGDGVVFRGQFGPWYSEQDKTFHLSRTAARDLLTGVIETYEQQGGRPLREVFLHSRSEISPEEFLGYQDACPEGVSLVSIRVRSDRNGMRLFRLGAMPVLRGTFWRLSDTSGLLWGAGFQPRLGTYPGWEVPVPMRIDVRSGEAPIERVAQDIMGLTKLNYNACRMGDNQPVTIGFSDAVGEILIANTSVSRPRPQFKFYI